MVMRGGSFKDQAKSVGKDVLVAGLVSLATILVNTLANILATCGTNGKDQEQRPWRGGDDDDL